MYCPLCNTNDRVSIDMLTRIRSHFCLKAKARIYWRGSVFSVRPLAQVPDGGGKDAA